MDTGLLMSVEMSGNGRPRHTFPDGEQERRVIKGGSFLCADNYALRPSALMGQTLDTATCHAGFRCAVDR